MPKRRINVLNATNPCFASYSEGTEHTVTQKGVTFLFDYTFKFFFEIQTLADLPNQL